MNKRDLERVETHSLFFMSFGDEVKRKRGGGTNSQENRTTEKRGTIPKETTQNSRSNLSAFDEVIQALITPISTMWREACTIAGGHKNQGSLVIN